MIKTYDIYSVNGILCLSSGSQGGRHIDYVADQVVGKLIEVVKKKNKAGVAVKPFQVHSSYCDPRSEIVLLHYCHNYESNTE